MRTLLSELFRSKKFVTALATDVAMVGAKLGWPEAKVEEMVALVVPLLAYILAQGYVDRGKVAPTAPPPNPPPPSST